MATDQIVFARHPDIGLFSRVGQFVALELEEGFVKFDLESLPVAWTQLKIDHRVPTADRNRHREFWNLPPALKRK